MFELMVESSFSGAHQLLKSKSPCENLHGHNWKVQIVVRGEKQNPDVGWVMDFGLIKTALRKELEKYDHKYLNDVLQTSPTAENIAKLIYTNLKKELPIYKVTVWETDTSGVSYLE